MSRLNPAYKLLGKIIIPTIIIVGLFIIPTICFILRNKNPEIPYGWILFAFICFIVIERVWETFYSSGENKRYKLHGDWTLPLVSIAYEIMLLGIILEYFLLNKELNILITSFALIIYLFSCLLRVAGMSTLKEQWAVHAIGAQKIKDAFLINNGPYKYIRHPIYLGVILEVISITLIWNSYLTLIFVILINVPLQLLRAYYEEKTSIRKLGDDYIQYKNTTPAFLPLNIFYTFKK